MSQPTDEEIVTALRLSVPEPPQAPDRLHRVRTRARRRRGLQVSAGAVATVAVLTAGVVLAERPGGRAAPSPIGAPTGSATAPDGLPTALHRALHLPTVAAGMPCPISPSHTFPAGSGFSASYDGVGSGPVALTGNGTIGVNFTHPQNDLYTGTGWPGMKAIWRIADSYTGPLLFRGGRLDAAGELRFDHYLNAVGETSANGDPDPTAYTSLGYESQDGIRYVRTEPSGVRMKAPGCYGVQVDGTDFSEVITFSVTSVTTT